MQEEGNEKAELLKNVLENKVGVTLTEPGRKAFFSGSPSAALCTAIREFARTVAMPSTPPEMVTSLCVKAAKEALVDGDTSFEAVARAVSAEAVPAVVNFGCIANGDKKALESVAVLQEETVTGVLTEVITFLGEKGFLQAGTDDAHQCTYIRGLTTAL